VSRRGFTVAVLGGLFVESCPACAGRTDAGFCAACRAMLVRVAAPCRACGLAQPVARCPRRSASWRVAAVVAPFEYAAPLDGYVHALKYRRARNLGRALGLLLAPASAGDVDALVPVPLHPRRLRERGYNQATEIARTLSRERALPVLLRGIARRGPYVPQTGQAAAARLRNVATAFAVERDVAGLRIAIVDDVITTGATVNALAAALLAAGAARCEAWAVARTPETTL
jgi:ComF family protein